MATNRDLLREAIADAKAVKETAIANAKAALTESFTPFLKEKLSQKISEMEEEDDEDFASKANPSKRMKEEKKRSDMTPDEKREYDEESRYLTSMEEISLDELLAELEEDPSEKMEEEKKRSDMTPDEKREYDEESRYLTSMEEELYEAKKDEKDEEMSLEDMSEDDLKSFIEDVIKDMVANKELEAGHEDMEDEEGAEEEDEPTDEEPTDEPADETADDEPADDEEVDLEELLAEMNSKENIEEEASMVYATDPEVIAAISTLLAGISGLAAVNWKEELTIAAKKGVKAVKEKVKSLLNNDKNSSKEDNTKDEELEEAYSTVKTLQSELNEINLLNAKLLYTNKIFRSKSLTESQKIKVLTAFDKAKTKKEAQLVYETLTEGLKVSITKTSIKESLGSASKSLGIAIKKPIIENDAFARMRELAGLKK
jgi:hypothetical protein